MTQPLRPVLGKNQITYDFGKGKGKETIHYEGSYFTSDALTRFAVELSKAKMDKQGNISANDVNAILLNFSENVRGKSEVPSLYPILQSCIDVDSEGGKNFTRAEQQKVMSILKEWNFGSWSDPKPQNSKSEKKEFVLYNPFTWF